MIHRTLRHIISILLLATYLPMVVLSSLHVHHDTIDLEDGCNRCAGHYEAQHHHHDDCQYCNFLSLLYLSQDAGETDAVLPEGNFCPAEIAEMAAIGCHGVAMLRAPPVA